MKRKMKNDEGAIETTLMGLLFSLTFSSIVISFLLLQVFGYAVVGNEKMITTLPDEQSLNPLQDYKSNDIVDSNYYNDNRYPLSKWVWIPDVGRVLTGSGGTEYKLLLNFVGEENGVRTVNYVINNSVKQDYSVVVREWTGSSFYNMNIHVHSDGFHLPDGILGITDTIYVPFPNANQIEHVKIKTEFNQKKGEVKFYFNDKLMFTKDGYPVPIVGIDYGHYAGVASQTDGFTVESINVGVFATLDQASVLEQLGAFINVLLQVVVWNVNSKFLPLELNLLFIKTQLAGIIICIVMILRGN